VRRAADKAGAAASLSATARLTSYALPSRVAMKEEHVGDALGSRAEPP